MSFSDRSDSSANIYFQNGEDVGENGPTIEYHDAPTATPSGNTPVNIPSDNASSPECPSADIHSENGRSESDIDETPVVNADPNVGMVIVRIDDGGPRPRRTSASEIVIPIDSVSSTEIIRDSQNDDVSSKDDNSPIITAQIESDDCTFTDEFADAENLHTFRQDSSYTPTENNEELDRENNQSVTSNSEYDESGESMTDNVSGTNEEDNINDDDSDNEDETTGGTMSTSNDMSQRSFANLCKRFKDGAAKYEEVIDARDRLGRQVLREHPDHPLSSHIALRMFSSLSANYKLKNIGYINLDSLPTTSNSENDCRIFNQQVSGVGDIVEITRENETPSDETPIENDSASPVCSTRFDFTPATRSKIEGARTSCSQTANGVCSVQSGRENAQAKYDSEVRPTHTGINMQTVNFRRKKIQHVLPPIPKSAGRSKPQAAQVEIKENTDILTKPIPVAAFEPTDKQLTTKSEFHNRKQCPVAKPGIPHQLRSVACYRDGKVDVSITGDTRLIPESEQLKVNITFVHRPVIQPNKDVKVTDETDYKHSAFIKRKSVPLPIKCSSPVIPPKSKGRADSIVTSCKRPLPPLKSRHNATRSNFGHMNNATQMAVNSKQTFNVPTNKELPPLRNIPRRHKRYGSTIERKFNGAISKKQDKRSNTKHESLNWDIVNARAQRPPFNTYINEEASERHQKIFADIPI